MRNLLDCFDCAKWLSGQDVQQCFLWCFKKVCHMMSPVLNIGGQACMWITWVIHRSSVTIHRVAQLERATTTLSLSITVPSALAETSFNSREVPSMAGIACTIPICCWGLLQGWRLWLVPPARLPPVGSDLMRGLTGSAAAMACSCCCAHLWSTELKIQVSIEAGNNFSFTKTWMLATVLEFHVEYFSVCVCMCTLLFAISA